MKQIANSIEILCISVGLDLDNLVGICLDGASAMAGKFKGVQACIRKRYPVAHYTHCSSHSLNLAIAQFKSCNTFSNLSSIISFFDRYPLREEKLRCAIQAVCPESKRGRLISLAETRWVERHDAIGISFHGVERSNRWRFGGINLVTWRNISEGESARLCMYII